jgi:hypothetical protein
MGTNITRTIIPAQPGWYVASFIEPEERNGEKLPGFFWFRPIVAWEIEREDGLYDPRACRPPSERWVCHEVTPISMDGSPSDHRLANIWAIKTPDGIFDFVGDTTVDNEAEALTYAAKLYHNRRDEQAKLQATG